MSLIELKATLKLPDDDDGFDRAAAWLIGDDAFAAGVEFGITKISAGWGYVGTPFTVVGVVKGKPDEKWSEVVRAEDPAEAMQKAMELAEGKTERTVAAVMPGDVSMLVEAGAANPPDMAGE